MKFFHLLLLSFFIVNKAYSSDTCFIAKEAGKIIKQEGKEKGTCELRHSPCSTFKIPIALMGFEAEILKTKDNPKIIFTKEISNKVSKDESIPYLFFHRRDQTPETWMKYSVVWYSQEITKLLGMEHFKNYTQQLKYGNMDVSGDKGKNNGLSNAWLVSSLQISPSEQVDFLEKLSKKELTFKKDSQEKTIGLMFLEDIWDGWKLYGKTGSGGGKNGWFVGWIEKGQRRIVFAQFLERNDSLSLSGGKLAKELAKDNLVSISLK